MPTTTITAEPNSQQIDIERSFSAPAQLAYRAMNDPELVERWLGPRRYETVMERNDLRDGGTWRFINRDADGNEFGFHGVYHGEPSVERVVRTFEFEGTPGRVSLESLGLVEHEGTTTMHARSVFQSVEDRDAMIAAGMEGGVIESYERLDTVLAELGVPA